MIDSHGEPVRENYRRQGEARERERIIALIERRICFDALADDDGRCSHHGGKCYDLRELINRLKKEATNGNV
jgi:hypothetical protein